MRSTPSTSRPARSPIRSWPASGRRSHWCPSSTTWPWTRPWGCSPPPRSGGPRGRPGASRRTSRRRGAGAGAMAGSSTSPGATRRPTSTCRRPGSSLSAACSGPPRAGSHPDHPAGHAARPPAVPPGAARPDGRGPPVARIRRRGRRRDRRHERPGVPARGQGRGPHDGRPARRPPARPVHDRRDAVDERAAGGDRGTGPGRRSRRRRAPLRLGRRLWLARHGRAPGRPVQRAPDHRRAAGHRRRPGSPGDRAPGLAVAVPRRALPVPGPDAGRADPPRGGAGRPARRRPAPAGLVPGPAADAHLLHLARPLRRGLRGRQVPSAHPGRDRVGARGGAASRPGHRLHPGGLTRSITMSLLLPDSDGIADFVERAVPGVPVLRYGQASPDALRDVTFYCLPYMGDAASVALIGELPRLAVVQSLSSGVDDVLGHLPPAVTLCNGQGLRHEEGTADLAVTLILASLRQLPSFLRHQDRREWKHARTDTLEGKRVLIVGYGPMGMAIEQRLIPFGPLVTKVSRTAREHVHPLEALPELAVTADVMVTCIALSPATRGLISESVLSAMPDGALLVNVARGAIVDSDALRRELLSGRLRAALDVLDIEPLPAERPEWQLPNVIITPHIGGDTFLFAARAPAFTAEQAARHLSGRPLRNVVRPALS